MWKQIMEIWVDVVLMLAFQESSWKRVSNRLDKKRKELNTYVK
ncbi:hypothetical protein BDE40_2807 [Litoreibacter halocynthiae]|uniref:Uncharacterized protein n=1 Tax=Litoreibacter halocynthiae TaxID=1242689 RepID=A0A4V3EWV5_9RHOB|nr:hypothetical protein BDE40_2807 [Litoreibacter halocynthiae]